MESTRRLFVLFPFTFRDDNRYVIFDFLTRCPLGVVSRVSCKILKYPKLPSGHLSRLYKLRDTKMRAKYMYSVNSILFSQNKQNLAAGHLR